MGSVASEMKMSQYTLYRNMAPFCDLAGQLQLVSPLNSKAIFTSHELKLNFLLNFYKNVMQVSIPV